MHADELGELQPKKKSKRRNEKILIWSWLFHSEKKKSKKKKKKINGDNGAFLPPQQKLPDKVQLLIVGLLIAQLSWWIALRYSTFNAKLQGTDSPSSSVSPHFCVFSSTCTVVFIFYRVLLCKNRSNKSYDIWKSSTLQTLQSIACFNLINNLINQIIYQFLMCNLISDIPSTLFDVFLPPPWNNFQLQRNITVSLLRFLDFRGNFYHSKKKIRKRKSYRSRPIDKNRISYFFIRNS